METTADTDAGSTAAQDFHRIPLDMDAIASQALAPKAPHWHVEFDCNGEPFFWEGSAMNARLADALARAQLWGRYPEVFFPSDARTVVCVQVSA